MTWLLVSASLFALPLAFASGYYLCSRRRARVIEALSILADSTHMRASGLNNELVRVRSMNAALELMNHELATEVNALRCRTRGDLFGSARRGVA